LALILLLDTATTVCSAALAEDGRILTHVSVNEGYRHAENVISLCRKVLSDAQKTTGQLDALAVSAGPGSYTGLRIGVSAAKGLCYGLDIPLIAVSTLQMMAANFYDHNPDFKGLAVPMIDARRMEVYTGIYNHQGECLLRDHALVMNESSLRLI
jgi:tRNA threonylcarbamoyladenosine biosynthesis protein TsaB